MIARHYITVSGVKSELLLSVTIVSNLLAIKAGLPGPQRGPVLLVG